MPSPGPPAPLPYAQLDPEQLGKILGEVGACRRAAEKCHAAAERCASAQVALTTRFDAHERGCTEWRGQMLARVTLDHAKLKDHSARFEAIQPGDLAAYNEDDAEEKTGVGRAASRGDVPTLAQMARLYRADAAKAQEQAQRDRKLLVRVILGVAGLTGTGGVVALVMKLLGS